MKNFSYEIVSGIKFCYIEEYFDYICDKKVSKYKYQSSGWVVELIQEKSRNFGIISIPCTRVIFSGDKEICEELICKFRKKFLNAGG